MKALFSACGVLAALGACASVWAQQPPAPRPAPATPAAPAAAQDEKMAAKALAAAAAEAEAARMRVEYAEGRRLATAYFLKSQARLKVYSILRFDPEMAKPREYFLLELTGAAIVEPVVLNLEDECSIQALINILERFEAESGKSNELKEKMGKRKTELGADLSREETRLVDYSRPPALMPNLSQRARPVSPQSRTSSQSPKTLGKWTRFPVFLGPPS